MVMVMLKSKRSQAYGLYVFVVAMQSGWIWGLVAACNSQDVPYSNHRGFVMDGMPISRWMRARYLTTELHWGRENREVVRFLPEPLVNFLGHLFEIIINSLF